MPPIELHITPETFSPTFSLSDACHIWLLDLNRLQDEVIIQQQALLTSSEKERVQGLKKTQKHAIAMRAFVRLCLASYTQIAPSELTIATSPKGKPYLKNVAQPIVFNLSHSQNIAVLAVGLEHKLGVDIEITSRQRSQYAIAERYFHPSEVAQLKTLTAIAQNTLFFKLWTLKEAFLKATGDGISGGLNNVVFDLQDGIHLNLAPKLNTSPLDWQFFQAFISPDVCVALARNSSLPLPVRWMNATDLFYPL